jgi:hypothetical protein
MPYIKISDPNIIDLAAWHQVINVVNQHSDSITSITNNFGAKGTGYTEWNNDIDIVQQYDPGSQQILFGKTRITTTLGGSSYSDGKHMFYEQVNFAPAGSGLTVFSGKPLITATVQFESPTLNTNGTNIICSIQGVTPNSFYIRVADARSYSDGTTAKPRLPITHGFFNVNWTAIGPK